MSWADYQVLGEEICSEPIDGLLVLSPLPSRQHQNASRQVMNHLEAHAPDGYEVAEGGCKPRADEYPPDVMGHPCAEEQT